MIWGEMATIPKVQLFFFACVYKAKSTEQAASPKGTRAQGWFFFSLQSDIVYFAICILQHTVPVTQ